jgi:hypothetical protein
MTISSHSPTVCALRYVIIPRNYLVDVGCHNDDRQGRADHSCSVVAELMERVDQQAELRRREDGARRASGRPPVHFCEVAIAVKLHR